MTPTALQHAPYYAAAAIAGAGSGVLFAWWLRRHTMVSIRNLYLAAATVLCGDIAVLYEHAARELRVMVPLTGFTVAGSAIGRRWRLSDLGAGEELRSHEQQRRWLWQPPIARRDGERVRIVTQGQIVRERAWPDAANPTWR